MQTGVYVVCADVVSWLPPLVFQTATRPPVLPKTDSSRPTIQDNLPLAPDASSNEAVVGVRGEEGIRRGSEASMYLAVVESALQWQQ